MVYINPWHIHTHPAEKIRKFQTQQGGFKTRPLKNMDFSYVYSFQDKCEQFTVDDNGGFKWDLKLCVCFVIYKEVFWLHPGGLYCLCDSWGLIQI